MKTFIVSTAAIHADRQRHVLRAHQVPVADHARRRLRHAERAWVTYYNQGEGFHGAPWNTAGIASGTPKSHGCTNMHVEDAKWVYDFLPIGAMVQIVGTTPTSAVR